MKLDLRATFGTALFSKDDATHRRIALAPDATRAFATSDHAKRVCLSVPSGEVERDLKLRGYWRGALFASRDRLMVFGQKAVLFDVGRGTELGAAKVSAGDWAVSPSGDEIALADDKGALVLVSAQDASVALKKKLPKGQGDVWQVCWADDERIVILHGTAAYDNANGRWERLARISVADRTGKPTPSALPAFENRRIVWAQSPRRDRIFVRDCDFNTHGDRGRAMILDGRARTVESSLPTRDTPALPIMAAFVDDDMVVCLSRVDLDPKDRTSEGRMALEAFSLSAQTVEELPLDGPAWGHVNAMAVANGTLLLATFERGLHCASLTR